MSSSLQIGLEIPPHGQTGQQIDKWLGSNRRDAVIARNAGLVVNGGLVKALELAGDATGILVGGLRTDAQWARRCAE